jgi:chorismate--pyruvate lyase
MVTPWCNSLALPSAHPLFPWLTYPHSFTERLQQHTQKPIEIELLSHQMNPENEALIREIYLRSDHHRWLYARTAIPFEGLKGKFQPLLEWGTKPIGNFLFSDPDIQREPFMFAELDKDDLYYQEAAKALTIAPEKLWARRAIFRANQDALLLTEVFLPGDW